MINIAVIQMCASGTKAENLELISEMVAKAVDGSNNLDLVCLPEYCYAVPNASSALEMAESIPGTYSDTLGKLAKTHSVNISAGSFVEKAEGNKVFNVSLFFGREGTILGLVRELLG